VTWIDWAKECVIAGVQKFFLGGNKMNWNQIDTTPIRKGWGIVFQGGSIDQQIKQLPGRIIIVNMDKGEQNAQYIDHKKVEAVLDVWIEDSPMATLDDDILVAHVQAAIIYLSSGLNLYIHCGAGVSRSSYFDIALHIAALAIPYDLALEQLKSKRHVAQPNPGFEAQLRRLQERLMKVVP
jgi:predicted protein tyrosine phosphatase